MDSKTETDAGAEAMIGTFRVYLLDWEKMGSAAVMSLTFGPETERKAAIQGAVKKFWYQTYSIPAHSLGEIWVRLSGEAPPPQNYSHRLMGIGDLVMDPDGILWLCEDVGWTQISRQEARQLLQPEVASA